VIELVAVSDFQPALIETQVGGGGVGTHVPAPGAAAAACMLHEKGIEVERVKPESLKDP
jgi:hypothetical protein